MTFKEWKIWFKSKPWLLRWFPLLILIRPIIDQFYDLKQISPVLSPLYWVGVLTPVLCVWAITKFKSSIKTQPVYIMNIWVALVIINSIIYLLIGSGNLITNLQIALKISVAAFLFPFLRVFIKSKIDLRGVIMTFLYSCSVVVALFIYELIFGPINPEVTRGTLERYGGGYADVVSYTIYIVIGFSSMVYYFLINQTRGLKMNKSKPFYLLLFTIILCVLMLTKTYHSTTLITFALIFGFAVMVIFSTRKYIGLVFILFFAIGYLAFGDKIESDVIDPLYNTEMEANEKDDPSFMFHGRMGRWIYAWQDFSDNTNPLGYLLGSNIGGCNSSFIISIGIHNDYMRIFYLTGIVGFISYFLSLIVVVMRSKFLNLRDKFLVYSSVIFILVYGFTGPITMFPVAMYFFLSVLAFVSLPQKILLNERNI